MNRRMRREAAAEALPATTTRRVRCAIYTRKSNERGLDRDFSSIDAQREACEAFIESQAGEGWTALPDRYEDGGFTGGNMERPGLQRLMADIESGRIDCVVTYKVDRLSRSLLDFARMMEVFERKQVSFVSVTQHFNTAQPMGRLILNVLLSFAQFEREIIAERTQDKMAASRRKGKWVGGNPVLGYDVDFNGRRLVVNEAEAEQVRAIFQLYAHERSLLDAARELNRRGWTTKLRRSRNGRSVGGRPFDKTRLWDLLTNWTYVGKVRYRGEIFEGEHAALIPQKLWDEVQTILRTNGRGPRGEGKVRHDSLLRGLLVCEHCETALVNHFAVRGGNRRYHYYVCSTAIKRGWDTCPTKSLPAAEMDRAVAEQIRSIAGDRSLRAEVLRIATKAAEAHALALEEERTKLTSELRTAAKEVKALARTMSSGSDASADRLATIQVRAQEAERRRSQIEAELESVASNRIEEAELAAALASFEPAWDGLSAAERARLARLLLERVAFDPRARTLKLTFRPSGIKALARMPGMAGVAA